MKKLFNKLVRIFNTVNSTMLFMGTLPGTGDSEIKPRQITTSEAKDQLKLFLNNAQIFLDAGYPDAALNNLDEADRLSERLIPQSSDFSELFTQKDKLRDEYAKQTWQLNIKEGEDPAQK